VGCLALVGVSAFVVAPLLQTWLMGEAGPGAAGLAAAVNISVFGLAGALGAGLGGVLLDAGVGLDRLSLAAAVPVLAAALVAWSLSHWSSSRRPPAPAAGPGRAS
jgi:DHA1 family inner membrane transport protein